MFGSPVGLRGELGSVFALKLFVLFFLWFFTIRLAFLAGHSIFLIFFSMPLKEAGSILSLLFSGNGTSETATSLIKSRLMSISRLDNDVGVDLASAFLFLATLDPELGYELFPPGTLDLLAGLLIPVSITEVGPTDVAVLLVTLAEGAPLVLTLGAPIPLLLLVVVVFPNTESELTTMVSVKFDVVNLAIASLDRRSLLLPV